MIFILFFQDGGHVIMSKKNQSLKKLHLYRYVPAKEAAVLFGNPIICINCLSLILIAHTDIFIERLVFG